MNKENQESGQIVILALVFAVAILLVISSLVGYAAMQARAHRQAVAREQGISIAEAGIEAAIWKLNNQAGYSGETNTAYGVGTYSITITGLSGSTKLIRSDAYIPNATSPKAKRSIQITANIGTTNIGFIYGIQVGDGGLDMGNNAIVSGNVYSNGNITGVNGSRINGDTIVAGPTGSITGVRIQNNSYSHFIDTSIVGGSATHTDLNNTTVALNAFVDSMSNCSIAGSATYNTDLSCTVGGTSTTPNTNVASDPPSIPLPIDQTQIDAWQQEAANGGTVGTQNISGTTTVLGPKKILGDLNLNNNSTLTLTGTIWVTGNINLNNGSILKLASSYGTLSGVVIAGTTGTTTAGSIVPSNGSQILGSGTAGSYLMMLSQKVGTSSSAITVSNTSSGAIFYAGTGRIDVGENAGAKEITGYQVRLDNNAVVTYETGLSNSNFTSGPGGGWEVADQTWQLLQ